MPFAARPARNRRTGGRTGAPGCRPGAGQAMLEFALVCGLFLAMLLAIVDSWVWTIESDAADAAVDQGIGVALAAPAGAPTSTSGDVGGVFPSISGMLARAMFATRVEPWRGAGPCPAGAAQAEPEGSGRVYVCAVDDGAGHVTVTVAGYAASLIPPGLSLFGVRSGGLPVFESASVTTGTYAP